MYVYILSFIIIILFVFLISTILIKISRKEGEMATYILEKSLSKAMLQTIGLLTLNLLANFIDNISNTKFLKLDFHSSFLIVVILGLIYFNLLIEMKKRGPRKG